MKQYYYAVIDTNVIVSALLVRHEDSATVRVMNEVTHGSIYFRASNHGCSFYAIGA